MIEGQVTLWLWGQQPSASFPQPDNGSTIRSPLCHTVLYILRNHENRMAHCSPPALARAPTGSQSVPQDATFMRQHPGLMPEPSSQQVWELLLPPTPTAAFGHLRSREARHHAFPSSFSPCFPPLQWLLTPAHPALL
jgi:hypothetical protein